MDIILDDQLNEKLLYALNVVSKEFDCLGIPKIDVKQPLNLVIYQLIDNARMLVRQNSKIQSVRRDEKLENVKLKNQINTANKTIDSLRAEIKANEARIAKLEVQLACKSKEMDNYGKDRKKLLKERAIIEKVHEAKENTFDHKLKKLQAEKQVLANKVVKGVGTFTSKDDIVAEELSKYKAKEEIYKETIAKLQSNNEGLLEEILNLKEEIVTCIYNKDKDSL